MKSTQYAFVTLLLFSILIFSCGEKQIPKVLVFSKTEGFRHESIAAGIEMFRDLASTNGFEIEATENASVFRQAELKKYQAVVFLSTTGDILDRSQEIEFRRYIQAGGGFVGIHAAADTEYDWPWYGELVGAYFTSHPNDPNVREARITKSENVHECTKHLPESWMRNDEWYNYKSIQEGIIPLLNLDESSYEGGTNGEYHPIAWYREFDGGRTFYTGGGHTDESFSEENFKIHVLKGLQWAMGENKPLDYSLETVTPEENRFRKEVLDSYFNEPMELELLPDGRVIFVERRGDIKLFDEKEGKSRVIAHINVFSDLEDGLLGIALDPKYSENKWAYICYSDPVESWQNISRFVFDPDADQVLSDEKVLLTVPTQRDECCHSAGSVEFDAWGNLYVSFGDNTNPHQSNGHSPSDERTGRYPFDAQKSSSNANDLRGKIIRIKPNDDGSYSIPDGNLFPKDGSGGRPEIYVMGCRNPFRFTIDPKNGYLYWGEVGPDANEDSETQGPRGYDEVNQAKGPGFFGWPYFIANNKAYRDFNFSTKSSGEYYNIEKPVNDSPNNTGVKELPPAQPAMVYYPYAKSQEFPYLGTGGRNAMAGFVYYYDMYSNPAKWPKYYDKKVFIYDWMRGWIMAVTLDEQGNYKTMEPFLPSFKWDNLMDVKMSDDGVLYTIEYGKGWFRENEDARLSRIIFNPGNRAPSAAISASVTAGASPLEVQFDATGSEDEDGDEMNYSWDFGDGSKGRGIKVTHSYITPGEFSASLTVSDKRGEKDTKSIRIINGNTPPELEISLDGNQSFYFPGKEVNYKVSAKDNEDGEVGADALAVSIEYLEKGFDLTNIAQGHEALAKLFSGHKGLGIIEGSDCFSCHKKDGISIGPSYLRIADKYKDHPDAIAYLAEKIIKGGSGVWGETAMAAHPGLSVEDARQIADYILSLNKIKVEQVVPPAGTYTFAIPKDKDQGGSFVMLASYSDKGAENVPSLRASKELMLRSPMMGATEFTEGEKASKFTITPDLNPMIKEDMYVVIMSDEAMVVYDELDLTGISSVVVLASAPAQFMSGGEISLHLDKPDSDPIASGKIGTASAPGQVSNVLLSLNGVSGKHKIILKTKSARQGGSTCIIMNLIFNAAE